MHYQGWALPQEVTTLALSHPLLQGNQYTSTGAFTINPEATTPPDLSLSCRARCISPPRYVLDQSSRVQSLSTHVDVAGHP